MSLSKAIFTDHPTSVFPVVSGALAAASLTPTPTFLPLVALIASLQLYIRIIRKRENAKVHLFVLWVSLTLGASAAHLAPAISSLSSGFSSVLSLLLLSSLSTFAGLGGVFLDAHLGSNLSGLTHLLLFPAIWATLWGALATGPVGRLFAWSPVEGIDAYRWLRPYAGPWGLDWVTAAWAAVLAQGVGAWFVGSADEDGADAGGAAAAKNVRPLILFEDDDVVAEDAVGGEGVPSPSVSPPSRSLSRTQARVVPLLACALLLLSTPSYFEEVLPATIRSPNITPITVGCVLPAPLVANRAPPAVEDFIKETNVMKPYAKVIIWPEGSVRFNSPKHRQETLSLIWNKTLSGWVGGYLGVGFEESVPEDAIGSHRNKLRNGFLVVNSQGTVQEYYKRNLVPIAESFSMIASSEPPTVDTLDIVWNMTTRQSRKHTRPVPITSSICLDFASASPFGALDTRPALILAPARTWHVGAGRAMWAQAGARAEELGSTVLWCDGGAGGVSGVAGAGTGAAGAIERVGQGSWMRTIAIEWPFEPQRQTVYARGGDWMALVIVWGLVGLGSVGSLGMAGRLVAVAKQGVDGGRPVAGLLAKVKALIAPRREGAQAVNGEQRPLLADV